MIHDLVTSARKLDDLEIIMSDANAAYQYARDVIKGRWHDAEEIIMTDFEIACEYEDYFNCKI